MVSLRPTDIFVISQISLMLRVFFVIFYEYDTGIYGGYTHQTSYTTIDISQLTFKLTKQYVELPVGHQEWGLKYEDYGLGISINVPIT